MSNSGGNLTVQYNLRWSEEMRDKIAAAAKENTRSMNQEIVARLEDSFSQNQNDFNAGYNACMIHMIIAASNVLSEKGVPWSDVQKALIKIVDDFHKISNEKKAP